jgi:hypothetical protein
MIRPGLAQAAGSVGFAGLTFGLVVVSASDRSALVAQLAGVAIVLLGLGLVMQSALMAGAATIPMLGAGLLGAGASSVRTLLVGCLWYLTVELAWDAIERNDGATRTAAANARRVQECSTVLGSAAVIGLVGTVAAPLAPDRTLIIQAVLILGFLCGLVIAARNLTKSSAL